MKCELLTDYCEISEQLRQGAHTEKTWHCWCQKNELGLTPLLQIREKVLKRLRKLPNVLKEMPQPSVEFSK